MKNKSISFEDRIYALIYQVYEFSKKTNKYDDKMFMILGSLFMLHKDFIKSKKEYILNNLRIKFLSIIPHPFT